MNNCRSDATCQDTEGTYFCLCATGFEGDGINECTNIDECALALAGSNNGDMGIGLIGGGEESTTAATTTTTAGTTTTTGETTTDMFIGVGRRKRRQADNNAAQCDSRAICVDNDGSYECLCPTGMRESASRVCEGSIRF